MPRTKIHIDRAKLIDAINAVESETNPPTNFAALYERVGVKLNVPAGAVLGRVKDYDLFPYMKTKPGRMTQQMLDKGVSANPKPERQETFTLDLSPFTRRGIVVTSLGDMLTSPLKDDETNRAIMAAIVEIRKDDALPALSLEEFRRLKRKGIDVPEV